MRKVTSKKDYPYVVETNDDESKVKKVRDFVSPSSQVESKWEYFVCYDSEEYDIENKLNKAQLMLPIISFETWQSLPDEEPKDLVLPEKWGIIGCEELTKYFKENKINSLDGGYYNQYYFINSQGEWDCQLIQFKDDETKIITFEQFKEHVLGKENINKLNVILTDISDKVKEKLKERKIVGYKLVKEEYKEAVKNILRCNQSQDSDFIIGLLIHTNSDFYRKLNDSGVLDLWFSPVYEESTETKIMDYLAEQGIEINEECASEIIKIINVK